MRLNTGVVSSTPQRVTIKAQLVRKAKGNYLMKSPYLMGNPEPCLWFLLRSKSSMQLSIGNHCCFISVMNEVYEPITQVLWVRMLHASE